MSRVHLALLAHLALSSSVAFAQTTPVPTPPPTTPPPFTSKDWSLNTATCVASTTVVSKLASYRLEIALDSTKARPVELRIVPSAELAPPTLGIKFVMDRKTTYAFAPLAQEAAAASTVQQFWNIPRGTKDLISYLKRESKFTVALVDASAVTSPLAFSLRGSSAVISEMQKVCNAKQDFTADGFERAFLPAVVANVDPAKLLAADTAKLRDFVAQALAAFRTSGTTQSQLNALSQSYLTQIAEFEKLRSNLDKLTSVTVANLTKRRNQSTANIDKANTEIPQLKTMVGQSEAVLAQANIALDQAANDIAPLLPDYQRYRSAVNNADSDLSAANSSLSQAQTYESQTRSRLQDVVDGISKSQADIDAINSAIYQTRSQLSNAQSEADRTRRIYTDAQSDRQRFNRDSELRERLSRDYRYGSLDNDLRTARDSVNTSRSRLSSLQSDRSRLQSDLSVCRQDPAANCDAQQNNLNQNDSATRQAQNDLDTADRRVRDICSEKERIENEARRDVDRRYDELVRCDNTAQDKYNDAQNCLNDINNRLSRYVNSDLPQAQGTLNSWVAARSGAENDVQNAVNSVARAQRDVRNADSALDAAQSRFSSWKQSSGYNAKKAVLTAAQQKVDETKMTLKHLDENISSREKLIRDETKSLADIDAQMQVALETIRVKEARSTEVQKILAPYFAQRDALMITKNAADQSFKDAQTGFAQGLPQLAPLAAN